jgi:predicted Zn-dependent protease with MMP-like domain
MMRAMVVMSLERFEQLVAEALDGLPAQLGAAMENVAVLVDDSFPPGRLLGLYEGIPLTRRGVNYSGAAPDRITIYMAAICSSCRSEQEVGALVRRTVIHEVAHHFGIDDEHLKQWGWG